MWDGTRITSSCLGCKKSGKFHVFGTKIYNMVRSECNVKDVKTFWRKFFDKQMAELTVGGSIPVL